MFPPCFCSLLLIPYSYFIFQGFLKILCIPSLAFPKPILTSEPANTFWSRDWIHLHLTGTWCTIEHPREQPALWNQNLFWIGNALNQKCVCESGRIWLVGNLPEPTILSLNLTKCLCESGETLWMIGITLYPDALHETQFPARDNLQRICIRNTINILILLI